MSYVKREFEATMYLLGPIDAYDWLLDNGYSEEQAQTFIDVFFGDI